MNIYEQIGLKKVINACGKMTPLGISAVNDLIAESIKQALQDYVEIDTLIRHTGKIIAKHTDTEDGCPTIGAAAGVAISVAATISKTNLHAVEQLPFFEGTANEIIIQKGHTIHFGASIKQIIALGGGHVVEAGYANRVYREHIEQSITANTSALLYVKSHHSVQKGMLPLEVMVDIAKVYNLPLIVDAAAEEDLKKYIKLGADMVVYSGGKALSGPTSGFICGKKEWMEACRMQYKGIGRAMKVSKEAMIGLIIALENYSSMYQNPETQKEKMMMLCNCLKAIPGVTTGIEQDEAGRPIYRARIQIDATKTGITANELSEALKKSNPAIYLRDYNSASGVLHVDPRPLLEGQEDIIVDRIKRIIGGK
ncbi:DgaE family pyridoxal phosphate-dependent ammonia lyase [Peribacillus simplex]|uniref:DgaE family pyridoxal phosphate-dependent ammonia lyase n=1 Tax=Peribacillus simplex TaxID=1478 RepID=A0A8B5XXZ6_9BACI|nr:DgaE family pyridoxal phosphate-dependent ammonia lyase [Peribacillus simplex]TVX80040.1 DgaE family pyridoxal phosphate-dependent ammonia lyase [Peribacillus simplex]